MAAAPFPAVVVRDFPTQPTTSGPRLPRMSEQRSDLPSPRGTTQTVAQSRKPFVKPTVQDMGGLKQLTLLGGSTP